jgi:DNA-binding transcriptional regulator GbsR (MarR family)
MPEMMHTEIQRLKRLHQGAELELSVLMNRSYLTPQEELEAHNLEKLSQRLKDRIAWVESVLREHEAA